MKVASRNSARRLAFIRDVAGFVGIAVGSPMLAAVIVLFGDASTMPWLAPTGANLALVQRCEALTDLAARQACAETVALAATAPDAPRRVASNGRLAGDSTPAD